MVTFKTIKFRHYREAQAIARRIENGEATDEEAVMFALELVSTWDFKDEDTQEPIPVGEVDELSLGQLNEVLAEFNRLMTGAAVPKVSAEHSPSASIN